nr:hypothetical protein [Desulfosporosinus sp. I2]
MDTLYETAKRDLPKCRSWYMAESPNSSLMAFCNGRHTVNGGSIPSSYFERSCFEWSSQNSWKDWKVIAVVTVPTIAMSTGTSIACSIAETCTSLPTTP